MFRFLKNIFNHWLAEFTNAQHSVTKGNTIVTNTSAHGPALGSLRSGQHSQDGGAVMLARSCGDMGMEQERKATTRKCLRSDTWWTSNHRASRRALEKG